MPIELTQLRGETYKQFRNSDGTITYSAHCKPIHYKDDWVNGQFLDIDESSKVEYADYTYYDKLPYKLKVYKTKIGYEIESKRTGDRYIVELDRINNLALTNTAIKTILANKDLLEFEFKISSHGVGLWKHLKTELSPKVFRWKIQEFAKPEFDTTKGALNFRYDTKAVDLVDEKAEVEIVTKKTVIDSSSFYWQETAPKAGISIDTDVTYYSSSADGYVYLSKLYEYTWADCHDALTGLAYNDSVESYAAAMGVRYEPNPSYYIFRSFFYFDTSGLPVTPTTATFSLYGFSLNTSNVCCMKGTQADTLSTDDYNNFTGLEYGHTAGWTTTDYNPISLNQQGIDDIVLDGVTKICAREYSSDYLNVEPTGAESLYYRNGCYFSEDTSGTKDPKLDITYGAGSTAYNQSVDGAFILSGIIKRDTTKTPVGIITFTGTFLKKAITKKPVGVLTLSGTVTKVGVFRRTITGIITFSGSIKKAITKKVVGALVLTGTIKRAITKTVIGALVLSGILKRGIGKTPVGAITFSGAITNKSIGKFPKGVLALTGTVAMQSVFNRTITGILTLSGNIKKSITKSVLGIITFSGAVVKKIAVSQIVSGIITFSGNITRIWSHSQLIEGIITFGGSVFKGMTKTLSGIITFTGHIAKIRAVISGIVYQYGKHFDFSNKGKSTNIQIKNKLNYANLAAGRDRKFGVKFNPFHFKNR